MRFPALAAVLLAAALPAAGQPSLKEAFAPWFLVGAALNQDHFYERDAAGVAIVRTHFNTITAENDLKWERVHPTADGYRWDAADRFVEFGEKNGMMIVGHCLVWHRQTPRWVFEDAQGNPIDRQALLKRMREHIFTVVGRYRGRIHGWDVVNEAVDEDGAMRPSPWMTIIGRDYVAKAFEYALEADPKAELYYNDYSLEREPKRKGALALVGELKRQGLRVTAVGLQGHDRLGSPTPEQQDATIAAFRALGVQVCITELDVDVLPRAPSADLNPYTAGLPEAVAQAQARHYADRFAVFRKHHEAIARVTFWGVTDRVSWLNYFPIRGRTNHPLLFDREGKPKPAFEAVMGVAPPQ